jgi:hypothetical protein
MKASELRIGNWVKIKDEIFEEGYLTGYDIYTTNEFQITGFNDGSSMKDCKVICFYEIPGKLFGGTIHSGCRDLDIDPIPLTEEWLLKFGFELDIEDDGYSKGKYKVSVSDEGCIFFIYDSYYPIEICEFKHTHQLQNLYFALTGEELEIKA